MSEPKRVQLSRKRGWRMPENTVKVTRPGKWGNPFVIGEMWNRQCMEPGGGQKCSGPVPDATEAVRLYRRFTAREAAVQVDAYRELRGKNLACWCAIDQPCHADVLLEIANREPTP